MSGLCGIFLHHFGNLLAPLSCTAFALASHSRVRTHRPSIRRGAHSCQFWTAWTFATKVLLSVDAVVAFVGAAFAFVCASWAKRENVGEYCQGVNAHDSFVEGGCGWPLAGKCSHRGSASSSPVALSPPVRSSPQFSSGVPVSRPTSPVQGACTLLAVR